MQSMVLSLLSCTCATSRGTASYPYLGTDSNLDNSPLSMVLGLRPECHVIQLATGNSRQCRARGQRQQLHRHAKLGLRISQSTLPRKAYVSY
ncbi:hypothetical protein LZ30DRAFT_735144 [Colletotrichum cereale]|nr:hypothetical protein LZ30DRAFT_735144 [Colletotrichum cereale]